MTPTRILGAKIHVEAKSFKFFYYFGKMTENGKKRSSLTSSYGKPFSVKGEMMGEMTGEIMGGMKFTEAL